VSIASVDRKCRSQVFEAYFPLTLRGSVLFLFACFSFHDFETRMNSGGGSEALP
jgi:hypothetical protein